MISGNNAIPATLGRSASTKDQAMCLDAMLDEVIRELIKFSER
jgi:hypothetical protein